MPKQTAGRNALGDFAPKFAELNDDVLFGEVWSRTDKLNLRDRSLITVVALVSQGIADNSLKYHINNAKEHGVTKAEIAEVLTHIAFYVGWPKAWAAFPLVKEVYADVTAKPAETFFGLGQPNEAYAKYFTGNSYLNMLNLNGVVVANVTFEPACRNFWHIHHAGKEGKGGQILLCTDGEGWYQEFGKPAQKLHPGDVVYIAPEVKHWHGAVKDEWFAHIAVEIPAEGSSNEWCEPVADEDYNAL